jgi:hypothetical protein
VSWWWANRYRTIERAIYIKEGVVKSPNVLTHTAEPPQANLRRAEIDRSLKGLQILRESQTPKERRANKIVKTEAQKVVIELEIGAAKIIGIDSRNQKLYRTNEGYDTRQP